ncbi:MAG TPA: DUF3471 domain-containing protein [Candidatus Sulfotelmatobacter sp.]|nr:DUF3471 domain-containing protein [Candidatus Sulfotelmatobacter sp.]
MLRYLYRCALRLHPPAFRRRFGDEMLSIYDVTNGSSLRFHLLTDSIFSLVRQWTLRSDFWSEASAVPALPAAWNGLPSFSTLDPFRPRASAVFHGVVLTATLFALTCFAIRYSWTRVLHVQIPEVEFEAAPYLHARASLSEPGQTQPPALQKDSYENVAAPAPSHLYVEPIPLEAEETLPPAVTSSTSKLVSSALGKPVPVLRSFQIRLRSYAGTYLSGSPRVTISIAIHSDQLVLRVGEEPERALSPLSKTTFVVEGSEGTELEFAAETDGKFHRLHLSEPSRQIFAQRQ